MGGRGVWVTSTWDTCPGLPGCYKGVSLGPRRIQGRSKGYRLLRGHLRALLRDRPQRLWGRSLAHSCPAHPWHLRTKESRVALSVGLIWLESAEAQTPGSEQLPTPVPDASSTPQDLPLRLNLTDAVRVSCEIEMVVIAIQKRFLQQEAIPEASLYLGEPSCNVSRSNSTHVFLVAGWGQCGTLVQSVSAPGCEPREGTSAWGGFAPGRETRRALHSWASDF